MTQPFNIQAKRSIYCQWEESLIFNESGNYLLDRDADLLIFFEVRDFFNSSSKLKTRMKSSQWKTIGWAFLNPLEEDGKSRTGKCLKLQLWKPRKFSNVSHTDLYSWWKSGSRTKYNSTLRVTLSIVDIDPCPEPVLRSMLPTQKEEGKISVIASSTQVPDPLMPSESQSFDKGSTRMGNCSIPTKRICRLPAYNDGCLIVKFSGDGTKIAGATSKCILIYDASNFQLLFTLKGHHNLIYDLDWSIGDTFLASCSSDSSARVWDMSERNSNILSHPCFVYCIRFLPRTTSALVSGCYDGTLRIWTKSVEEWTLLQEIDGHMGFINALSFSDDCNLLFSGDENGYICSWNVLQQSKDEKLVNFNNKFKLKDIRGKIINNLITRGSYLYVHTRDSFIRKVKYDSWTVQEMFSGFINEKKQMRSCLSPCGSFMFSGSENSFIYIWNVHTGLLENTIDTEGFIPSSVDFHPIQDILVVSSYMPNTPILIFRAHESSTTKPAIGMVDDPESKSLKNEAKNILRSNCNDILTKLDVVLRMAEKTPSVNTKISQSGNKAHRHASLHIVNEKAPSTSTSPHGRSQNYASPPSTSNVTSAMDSEIIDQNYSHSSQCSMKMTARQRRHLRVSESSAFT